MHRFDSLRVWRRIGGARTVLVVALVVTIAAGFFGSGALFISHAFAGNAHAHTTKPGIPGKKDEGAWFQLSHIGKSQPPADARAKALQQAAQIPLSRLNPATPASSQAGILNPNLAMAGGGWAPLGPVGEDSSTCPSNCNNYGVNSGRVTAEAVNPSNGSDIWVGTADGGLWHSTDSGAHWTSVSDNSTVNGAAWPTLSIGAIAIDPANASTIYVGTGESNLNGDAYWGVGIFKSTDSGAHWTQYGASQFGGLGFAKLAVDPHNSATLLAAVGFNGYTAPSGASAPWANTGIWQSTDSGQTWTQVLHNIANNSNHFDAGTDLVFDVAHSGAVYAGFANSFGAPASSFSSGAGVWYSANSGGSWQQLSIGIPTGNDIQRVSLGLSADGTHIYAALTDGDTRDYPSEPSFGNLLNSSIYASVNSGQLWTAVNISGVAGMANNDNGQQWWYDSYVAVDPTDANTVYVGGVDIWQTQAGATSTTLNWTNLTTVYGVSPVGPHPDQHALVFQPGSSNYFIGNDGGVWTGTKTGTFTNRNTGGLNITQFYQGSIGEIGSYAQLYGGAQDNGEIRYPGTSVTAAAQWNETFGGDGGDTAVDYTNNAIAYEEYVGGAIHKTIDGGTSWNPATSGISSTDPVNFIAPFTMWQNTPTTLAMGTDKVYLTTNGASSWSPISASLDGSKVSAVAIAPSSASVLYAGTNYGRVFATTNGGTSWQSNSGFYCQVSMVTAIAIDPTNPSVAYATCAGFVSGAGQHIYKTTDAALHWSDVSGSLPNIPFESVAVDPANHSLVVAGSDAGVFISQDAGTTWANLGSGLPNASVNQVFFDHTGGRLFVATHGRGMWELPLAQFASTPGWVNAAATTPGGSPAAQTVALKNTGFAPLNWTLNGASVPSWLNVTPSSGTLTPGQSTTLTFAFTMPTAPTTPQTYTAQVQFNDPHATNDGFQIPVHVNTNNVSTQWYFAEGYMGSGFDTLIALANPNPVHASVTITYHLDKAPWVVTHSGIDLAPYGRFTDGITKFVRSQPGVDPTYPYGVATTITSDQPIVAERPMYFNNYANGFDVVGATHLSSTFAFDDLNASSGYLTILTFLNPTNAPMYANMTFYAAATGTPTTLQYVIPANARGGYDVGQHVPVPGLYSGLITLTSDQAGTNSVQGLIERPMYWTNPTSGFYNGECVMGVASPQTDWDFAEGWTNPGGANQGTFHETLYLAHPSAASAVDAHATVTIYREDGGAPVTVNVTLPHGQTKTVDINAALPPTNSKGNSIKVTSDQPILAERLMTWDAGATDVLGAQHTADIAYFAEGYTGTGFTGILTLENPNSTPAHLTITYLPAHDSDPSVVPPPVTMTWIIPANARSGFGLNSIMPNQGFATVIVSDQPILAERVMYFDGNRAGTDAIGYQGEP